MAALEAVFAQVKGVDEFLEKMSLSA